MIFVTKGVRARTAADTVPAGLGWAGLAGLGFIRLSLSLTSVI